jgi:hypothetical protein
MTISASLARPDLSLFDPLPRIITFDNFDQGMNGWGALIGNYEGTLDNMLPGFRDLRPPMLSNLTVWDTGTDGAMSGTYALKLATRAQPGSTAVGIKRLTFREPCPIRLEAYITFKPEASELDLSETDVRWFALVLDLQGSDTLAGQPGSNRVMPHLRYLNARNGQPVHRWQYKRQREPLADIGASGKTQSHFHLEDHGWEDLPDGDQLLCYNELPTKQNWHYIRLDIDLRTMSFIGFRCNDRVFDLSVIEPMKIPAMKNLWNMLNLLFVAQTDGHKRTFLYVDSVLVSGEW